MLRFFLVSNRYEEIAPDLDELFSERRASKERFASWKYLYDVISIVSRRSLRQHRRAWIAELQPVSRGPIMLKNYLLVAVRHLKKRKGFTFINAAGLGTGLACCLFILLFVRDELKYDRHIEGSGLMFRVTADYEDGGQHWAPIGPPIGPALAADFPEIEASTRFFPHTQGVVLKRGDTQFHEIDGGFADSTFLEFFSFEMIEGIADQALTNPETIVLSESTARKYFGDGPALGETLSLVGYEDVTVSGVFKDQPSTTHIPVNYLSPMSAFYRNAGDWVDGATTWAAFHTYLKLHNSLSASSLESKLPAFTDRLLEGRFDDPGSEVVTYHLQPLTDIHLHSHLEKEYLANGDIAYVYTFSIVALFILLVACVNFVNLATARAASRMHEVAVRKTFGALRKQLIRQYLGESILLSFLGLLIALGIIFLFLPTFNSLTGKALQISHVVTSSMAIWLVLMTAFAGIVAGIYPAFVLSGYKPAAAFKGGTSRTSGRTLLRKGLVVFQFSISIFLIAGSIIIWQQLDFFRTQQLGFDKEHVLDVRLSEAQINAVAENPETIKSELLRNPAILSVSNATDLPGERISLESVTVDGLVEEEVQLRFAWHTDHDYVEALGLEIVEGRSFSKEAPTDTSGWLMNETAVKLLRLDEPIGQTMRWGDYSGPVVGVIRDFNFRSLHHAIEPLVIPLRPGFSNRLLVRFASDDPAAVVDHVHAAMDHVFPGSLFEYYFVGDSVDALYKDENTLRDIIGYFSLMAIFIASLGLFGLAAFTAEQRTKEIGVRKVLGASSRSILGLMSREFVILIGVSFAVAAPLTWIAAGNWLGNFAFRIEVNPLVILFAGVAAAMTALVAVLYQTAGAARANPVDSLRHE